MKESSHHSSKLYQLKAVNHGGTTFQIQGCAEELSHDHHVCRMLANATKVQDNHEGHHDNVDVVKED